jgi:hypothetical protein
MNRLSSLSELKKKIAMNKEGFTIHFQGKDVKVSPVYMDDIIHYKVELPGGDKFLRLEEKEGKRLSWYFRGEGNTPEAEIIGKLVEARVM